MTYEWDEKKNRGNLAKHGVAFETVHNFDWNGAITWEDVRFDYREARYISVGKINGRLHVVVHTERAGQKRIIGLRKANKREEIRYEEEKTIMDQ
jgi:uncharacterized protein